MRILREARRYLSFGDLCATRPVSKEWNDISTIPYEYPVFFSEDGSLYGLPSSRDANFRKCLLAASLQKFHCQIFTEDQLQFVLRLMPEIIDLTIEIDGREGDDDLQPDEIPPAWNPNSLSIARKARRIELSFTNLSGVETRIDFNALENLTHFESDEKVHFENFDMRDMELFGYYVDFWDENATQVANHAQTLRISRIASFAPSYIDFSEQWCQQQERRTPNTIEMQHLGMTFFVLTRDTMTAMPVFHLQETETLDWLNEYQIAFEYFLQRQPGISLRFDTGCTDEMRQKWLEIINPICNRFGLPPIAIIQNA